MILKIRQSFKNLLFLFAILSLLSVEVQAGPLGYKEGRWVVKTKQSYFGTSKNFDKDGTSKELTSNQSLMLLTNSLSATYDQSEKLSLFSILDTVYGKSVGIDFQRTRFTPTDLKLGADYLIFSSIVDVVPEVMLTVPIVGVDSGTDELIPSEGVVEIRAGTYVSKSFDWLSGYAYIGYASRGDGRSSILPYEVQVIKSFGSLQATAGLWGYESVSDDDKTATPTQRTAVTTRVNGGSQRFYAVNPSVTELGGSLGLPVGEDMFGRIGYSHTIFGANTAYGDTFWASLSYSFGSSPRAAYRETKKSQEKVEEKKKKDFKPESYEEETVFGEAVKVIQKEEVPGQKAVPAIEESKTKAPVSVKLRAAKPEKKPKKKKNK